MLNSLSLKNITKTLVNILSELKPSFIEGTSEYDLIKRLQGPPYGLFDNNLSDSLILFQCHFVLFNALYHLRETWLQSEVGQLQIHTSRIHLLPFQPGQVALTPQDGLREYYMDWQNFDSTNSQDVAELIEGFWQNFARGSKAVTVVDEATKRNALRLLQIPTDTPITRKSIKRSYRQLQHQAHPDKGGDEELSKAFTDAYKVLMKIYKN